MSDIIPLVAVITLIGNAVLMIAYAQLHSRLETAEFEATDLLRHALRVTQSMRELRRNSVRRDPKTGRYLKNRSN